MRKHNYISAMPTLKQQGASLLEVLITILIMSFGLLALGGLTTASLQYNKMAQFQTIGLQLASEYADRMRSNVTAFNANSYNITASYTGASASVSVPSCASTICTAAEIAAIDIAEWTNALRRRLPGGAAFVQRNGSLAVDIWVMWVDPSLLYTSASGNSDAAVAAAGSNCPAAALTNLPTGVTAPRCMYFRVSL